MEKITVIIFIIFILMLFFISAIVRMNDAKKGANLSEDDRIQKTHHNFGIVTSVILLVGVSIVAILVFLSFLIKEIP
jgi:hypothetical protein